jgi:hypothetical protein
VGEASAESNIQVRPILRGTLVVHPEYLGLRTLDGWHVTVLPEADCSNYASYDLPGKTQSFPLGRPIVLERQPAERPLTVLLRSRHSVFGCKQDVLLSVNQSSTVTVSALDRPLQIRDLDMPLTLGLGPSPSLQGEVNAVLETMVLAFAGAVSDAVALHQALLSAAQQLEPPPGDSELEAWRARVTQFMGDQAEGGLREALRVWLLAGSDRLYDPAFFVGRLRTSGSATGRAVLSLSAVAGSSPRNVGMPETYLATFVATPGDSLRADVTFHFQPSRLFAQLAEGALQAGGPIAAPPLTLPQTLAARLNCEALGRALTQSARPEEIGAATEELVCNSACAAKLCRTALAEMWLAATLAEPGPASIQVLAAGPSKVNDDAQPMGFSGEWLGEARFPDGMTQVQGPFSAQATTRR